LYTEAIKQITCTSLINIRFLYSLQAFGNKKRFLVGEQMWFIYVDSLSGEVGKKAHGL
jgi:hypothetical protein